MTPDSRHLELPTLDPRHAHGLTVYPLRLIAALAAASALSVAALLVDIHESGSSFYRFLVWNLVLAWIPVAAALACNAFARRRAYVLAVAPGSSGFCSSRTPRTC